MPSSFAHGTRCHSATAHIGNGSSRGDAPRNYLPRYPLSG
ncbi:hypothetical protein HT136_12775 [Novosphingobium profundi]|nr:hypothetical protein [Novosphingobium profundi]